MDSPARLERPSKDEIASLPIYEQLPAERIHLIRNFGQAEFATRHLAEAGFVGFDSETKPVFVPGTRPDGPHVIQLATLEHAFIVQVNADMPLDFLKDILESKDILKVGFGLKSDRGPLHRKLDIKLSATVELSNIVRKLGYRQAVGVKAAVAIVLGQKLPKPKKMTISNWGLQTLFPNQLQYAANDAHAALAVFHALGCPYAPAGEAGPNPSLNRSANGRPPGPVCGAAHSPHPGPGVLPLAPG
jgi:3'-5' exonuclease